LPHLETPEKSSGAIGYFKNKWLWFCFLAIFLGGAAECTMAQWSSGFLESALGIPKVWGDIFGVALFAVFLGLGRTLYSKFGKSIGKVLFAGAIGASVCYFVAIFSPWPIFGLLACAFTGFCVSMMWPGCLIVATDKIPNANVLVFAMMAAGGDLGASVGPQLVGVVTDAVLLNPKAVSFVSSMGLTAEQLGMKIGMLCGMIFPLIAIFIFLRVWKSKKEHTALPLK
jgi:fucose permease